MTTTEQGHRLEAAKELMFRDLNRGNPNGEYTVAWHPENPQIAFGVFYKSRSNTQDRKTYPGITRRQALVIEQTSDSIQEIADRMKLLIIDGKDTTRFDKPVPQGVDPEMLNRLVSERVEEFLKKHQPPQVEGQGIQPKRYVRNDARINAIRQEIELWQRRATQVNFSQPVLTQAGKIDKRWLITAQAKWNAFVAKNGDPEAQQPTE